MTTSISNIYHLDKKKRKKNPLVPLILSLHQNSSKNRDKNTLLAICLRDHTSSFLKILSSRFQEPGLIPEGYQRDSGYSEDPMLPGGLVTLDIAYNQQLPCS